MTATRASARSSAHNRALWAAITLLLIMAIAAGGSARSDIPALLPLRLAAIAALVIGITLPGTRSLLGVRPLQLLAALAGVAILQLIPLPPALWRALPGHDLAARIADAAGLGRGWQPVSLTPDLTLDSLMSLLPPAAMLVLAYRIEPSQRLMLLPAVAVLAMLSGFAGVWQLASAGDPDTYLYAIAHLGWPTGAFANRNHQAVLLAVALPLLAAWTSVASDSSQRRVRGILAVVIALFLAAMIVAAGSRAGLVLGAIAMLGALTLVAQTHGGRERAGVLVAVGLTIVVMVAGVALAGRSAVFTRLADLDIGQEQRVVNTPLVIDLVGQYFPLGSGLGSFDPVFRIYETDAMLQRTFYNHAHNDLLELAMTGGLAALAILIVFIVWLVRGWLFAADADHPIAAKGAAIGILIILGSSLVDYPLRTPLMAIIIAILCSLFDTRPPRRVNHK